MQDLDYACGSREVPGRERFHALGRDRGVVHHRHFCGDFRRGPWLAPLVLQSLTTALGKSRATARTHLDGSRIKS
jgi:hypothetical protein